MIGYHGTADAAGGPTAGVVFAFDREPELSFQEYGLAYATVVFSGFNPSAGANLSTVKVFGKATPSDEWALIDTIRYDDNYYNFGSQHAVSLGFHTAPYLRFELFGNNAGLGTKAVDIYVLA
jgi:hypothetical protein